MIVMKLSGEALTFFTKAAQAFPHEIRSAAGQVASVVGRRMRKAMAIGGGVHGVDPFAQHSLLTNFLRGVRRPIGGKLTQPHMIKWWRDGKYNQVIGFLTAVDKYASAFQSAEYRFFSKEERHMFYRRGIKGKMEEYVGVKFNKRSAELAAMARGYIRPPRPMVEPVIANANPELAGWMHGAFSKALMRGKIMRAAA